MSLAGKTHAEVMAVCAKIHEGNKEMRLDLDRLRTDMDRRLAKLDREIKVLWRCRFRFPVSYVGIGKLFEAEPILIINERCSHDQTIGCICSM